MFFYSIRRIMAAVLMLIVMSIVTFLLFYASPTDPARLTCGKNCTPASIEANRHTSASTSRCRCSTASSCKGMVVDRHFPDDPSLAQAHPELITNCTRPASATRRCATRDLDLLKPRIPVTAVLSLAAFVMWIGAGVLFGILAALSRGKIVDRPSSPARCCSTRSRRSSSDCCCSSLSSFQLQLCRRPGYVSPTANSGDFLHNLFLPALTLAAVYAAAYIRITRTYMLETMGEDYLRTATAKGLHERTIIFKHTPACGADAHRHPRRSRPRWAARRCADHRDDLRLPGHRLAQVQAATAFDLPMIVGS